MLRFRGLHLLCRQRLLQRLHQQRDVLRRRRRAHQPDAEYFPREWPARVAIELETGERYEDSVRYPKGDPENPLTCEEMAAKFRSLAWSATAGASRW